MDMKEIELLQRYLSAVTGFISVRFYLQGKIPRPVLTTITPEELRELERDTRKLLDEVMN